MFSLPQKGWLTLQLHFIPFWGLRAPQQYPEVDPGLAQDGQALRSKELATGWVISPSQVVEVLAATNGLPNTAQLLVLFPAHHLALVGDCLDIILIFMRGLVQGMLGNMKEDSECDQHYALTTKNQM